RFSRDWSSDVCSSDLDSLILFPEGTRSPTGEMGPFKPGVFHLVQSCPEVEIVPTYLHNLGRVLPRGEFAPVPLLASVTFGAPLRDRKSVVEGKSGGLR